MADAFTRSHVEIRPPAIDLGQHTVKILVGVENGMKEFAVHKALLYAASQYFDRTLSGSFVEGQQQEMKLPDEDPQLFEYFVDWLYMGKTYPSQRLADSASKLWTVDYFWLKVYKLAERLACPGLQLTAYVRVRFLFNQGTPTIPSREFICCLFDEDCPLVLQMHVVEHIAYWLPKSTDQHEWANLFDLSDRFAAEMAKAMVRNNQREAIFLHPNKQAEFAERYGFDNRGLATQARENDAIPEAGEIKAELMQARLLPEPDNIAAGVKRPSPETSPETSPPMRPPRRSFLKRPIKKSRY